MTTRGSTARLHAALSGPGRAGWRVSRGGTSSLSLSPRPSCPASARICPHTIRAGFYVIVSAHRRATRPADSRNGGPPRIFVLRSGCAFPCLCLSKGRRSPAQASGFRSELKRPWLRVQRSHDGSAGWIRAPSTAHRARRRVTAMRLVSSMLAAAAIIAAASFGRECLAGQGSRATTGPAATLRIETRCTRGLVQPALGRGTFTDLLLPERPSRAPPLRALRSRARLRPGRPPGGVSHVASQQGPRYKSGWARACWPLTSLIPRLLWGGQCAKQLRLPCSGGEPHSARNAWLPVVSD